MRERAAALAALLLAAACSPAPSSKGMVSEEALAIAVQKNVELEESFARQRSELQRKVDELTAENALLKERLRSSGDVMRAPDLDQPPAPPEKATDAVEFVNLAVKPIDSSSSYAKYSWRAMVRNNTSQPRSVLVTVNFLDADGFKLDYGNERVTLQPREERVISQTTSIKVELAARVARYSGKIE